MALMLAPVASADATDPHELWERATPKTIRELRTRSKQEVAEQILTLDKLKANISAEAVIERYVQGNYLLSTLGYWAIAESRAEWISSVVDPAFEKDVFTPMLDAFRRGVAECDKAVNDAEAARKTPAAAEPRNAQWLEGIIKNTARDSACVRALQLATLAKLANRPDLVSKVAEVVPLTRGVRGVRKPYGSIDEFMADKQDIDRWLKLDTFDTEGKDRSPPPRPTATKPAVPEQTRRRIEELFEKYIAALAAKDVNALAPLFAAPDRYKAIVARLGTTGIRNVDLSKATWNIEAGPGGVWKVTVTNITMDTKDGLKDWETGSGELEMVVVEQEGVARILRTEGDQ